MLVQSGYVKRKLKFSLLSFFLIGRMIVSDSLIAPSQINSNNIDWKEKIFDGGYTLASYLTDPCLAAHRWVRQIPIAHVLYPHSSGLELYARKGLFAMEAAASGLTAIIATPIGILLRFLLVSLQSESYLYYPGHAAEKIPGGSFSLLSWNLCCVCGGYSITDGGVLPWVFRKNQLVNALLKQDADVVCLYEIFDIQTAHHLIESLKDVYSHFYYCIGPKVIGLSSGLFIASKIHVTNPSFLLFPEKALDGRTKYCNKGCFSFDIQNSYSRSARIFSTHLGHSEMPAFPTDEEKEARRMQMALIVDQMKDIEGKAVILTGDLNLSDEEYKELDWPRYFDKGKISSGGFTWGGDAFCAGLAHKNPSSPTNLDYTVVLQGTGATLLTSYIDTGFDGTVFLPQALSDHKGILSRIVFW